MSPDGLAVTLPWSGVTLDAAMEATRRLQTTVGDVAVLLAVLAAVRA